jgi:hypothetical protein
MNLAIDFLKNSLAYYPNMAITQLINKFAIIQPTYFSWQENKEVSVFFRETL